MNVDVMDMATRTHRGTVPAPGSTLRKAGRTALVVLALAVAGVGASSLSGCSGKGADVSCSINNCTVTLDRGADAEASVLGIKVKLIGVENDQVTVDVGGNRLVLPVDGSGQAGGATVVVQKITADQVVLQISTN